MTPEVAREFPLLVFSLATTDRTGPFIQQGIGMIFSKTTVLSHHEQSLCRLEWEIPGRGQTTDFSRELVNDYL